MTTPKFLKSNPLAGSNLDAFKDFRCSERTSKVDFESIKSDVIEALVHVPVATGLAVKFALHGHRIKEGDYFYVGGNNYIVADTMKTIHNHQLANGRIAALPKETGKGIGKHSDKNMASVTRIARSFASDVIFLVSKSVIKLPPDLATLADGTGLPAQFSFLDSPYGMDDNELEKHKVSFHKFCLNFNEAVRVAYNSGNYETTGGKIRDHASEFNIYLKWRGLGEIV